jgi:hypothetical protein
MSTLDPSVLGLLIAVMAVAAGVFLLGRHLSLLEQQHLERCAACGRLRPRGRRCICSG